MSQDILTCPTCAMEFTSIPSMWSHYRRTHQRQVNDPDLPVHSSYIAPHNIDSDPNTDLTPCIGEHNAYLCGSSDSTSLDMYALRRLMTQKRRFKQNNVTHPVRSFFNMLPQHSTPLLSGVTEPYAALAELLDDFAVFVTFAMTRTLSASFHADIYTLLTEYELSSGVNAGSVMHIFPTRNAFLK